MHCRQLGCLIGDSRHECLYFNPEILNSMGSNLGNMLETNSITSTIFTTRSDMVTGFNFLTLLDLIPVTIGVSGSLSGKEEIVLEAS